MNSRAYCLSAVLGLSLLSVACKPAPFCGDGEIDDETEDCDNFGEAARDCDYSAVECTICDDTCHFAPGVTHSCGDGTTDDAYEDCDDGNEVTEGCDYGETECMVCDDDCHEVAGAISVCGDGTIDEANEDCDDSNTVTEVCDYDVESCVVCDDTCHETAGELFSCGDGNIDSPDEDCDDGNAVTEVCDYGDTDCVVCDDTCNEAAGETFTCGDGDIDSPDEDCDDSNAVTEVCDYDAESCMVCDDTCHETAGEIFFCGDGDIDSPDEDCDDGNAVTEVCDYGDTECVVCDDTCNEAPGETFVCGDSDIDGPDEDCDDGNAITDVCDYDAESCVICDDTCHEAAGAISFCGDGNIDSPDENCDDSNAFTEACVYGETECIVCDDTCNELDGETSYCGDATIDRSNDERCDSESFCKTGCDFSIDAIALGLSHTCVLRDGEVFCWGGDGAEGYGQSGYGDTDIIGDDETPRDHYVALTLPNEGAVDIGATAVQIVAGAYHTCVLTDAHKVRCWGGGDGGNGMGSFGQLGYGSDEIVGDDETPAEWYATNGMAEVELGGDVSQLAAGAFHTCALMSATNTVRCWGGGLFDETNGELGYGYRHTIGDSETPVEYYSNIGNPDGDVDFGPGTATQIVAGDFFTCVLLDTGAVRCWGDDSPALGTGNGLRDSIGKWETPAQYYTNYAIPNNGDIDIGGVATSLAAASEHVCALMEGGTVRCWGEGWDGRLGYGGRTSVGSSETPAEYYADIGTNGDVDLGPGTVVKLHAGGAHTCALLDTGAVRCWGEGESGRLGYGAVHDIGDEADIDPSTPPGADPETPARHYEFHSLPNDGDLSLGAPIDLLAIGWYHTCAVTDLGHVQCWGQGEGGQLGQGDVLHIGDDELPDSVPPVSF